MEKNQKSSTFGTPVVSNTKDIQNKTNTVKSSMNKTDDKKIANNGDKKSPSASK